MDLHGGIDVGGTKMGVSIGTLDGQVLASTTFATEAHAEPDAIVSRLVDELRTLVQRHASGAHLTSVGCACPGPMSSREGRFLDPPNMPRWHDFAFAHALEARLACPISMMNDANAGALAEWLYGAARGCDDMAFLTMATGMGAGLILGGRLHQGRDDLAGEIGHLRLAEDGPVGFGKRGSVEGFTSGPGIVQLARAEALIAQQRGDATALLMDGVVRTDLDVAFVCEAAERGDVVARRAIERSADALGRTCALLVDLLNLECIVLGTIGTRRFDLFAPRARAVLEREALPRAASRVRLVPSALGERRGHLQALAVAWYAEAVREGRVP